jgi:hypothetical protein
MGFWDIMRGIAGGALMPLTGGLSSALIPGARGSASSAPAGPQPLTPEEQAFINQLMGSAGTAATRSNEFLDRSGSLFDTAGRGFTQAGDYWSKILGGDDKALMELMGPETDAIAKQYDTARKNIQATAPRGGGRSFALSKSRYEQAGDVGTLLTKARPMAAQQILGVASGAAGAGSAAGGIGTGEAGIGTSALTSGLGSLTSRRGQDVFADVQREQLRNQRERDVGGGLASLISTLFPMIKSGGGSSGSRGDGMPRDIINGVPQAPGSTLYGTPIPKLAEGGIVTKPTVAMIGEAGPEAVVPLSGAGGGSANLARPGEPDIRMVAEAIHRKTGLTGPALAKLVQMWLMKHRMQPEAASA